MGTYINFDLVDTAELCGINIKRSTLTSDEVEAAQYCEQVLKRRLDDLDQDFSLPQMQSQELSLRAVKNQMEMPLAT